MKKLMTASWCQKEKIRNYLALDSGAWAKSETVTKEVEFFCKCLLLSKGPTVY